MDPSCHLCGASVEDVDHILRKCSLVVHYWSNLINKDRIGTVGGVIRDALGLWCLGFARSKRMCNAYEVELWDILDGLD
ncbi:hypothetical protein Golob_000054 [Gossypium lobatum]|uniref:RNase H type-1 domain-containing protein n=1 Tax=Gossypium lobatum TaxID=34289 RepID=A0A7J8NIB4_9ROSI|nr:hypothetical protein [Gossypium lobatum]